MKKLTLIFSVFAVAGLASGCSDDECSARTDHPETGKITLTTVWDDRGTDVAIPGSYTVKVGDYTETVSGTTNEITRLFDPATYGILVYNTVNGVTVANDVATVTPLPRTRQTANLIEAAPGWFFSSTPVTLDVKADTDYDVTAVMHQQVRKLTFKITPQGDAVDNIESITANLSGVAGTLNLNTGVHGAPSSVNLVFADNQDGTWSATVFLLGVVEGQTSKLTGIVKFDDPLLEDIIIDSDVTTSLANFNNDMEDPLELQGVAVITPTEAVVTTVITDWVAGNGTGTDTSL